MKAIRILIPCCCHSTAGTHDPSACAEDGERSPPNTVDVV